MEKQKNAVTVSRSSVLLLMLTAIAEIANTNATGAQADATIAGPHWCAAGMRGGAFMDRRASE